LIDRRIVGGGVNPVSAQERAHGSDRRVLTFRVPAAPFAPAATWRRPNVLARPPPVATAAVAGGVLGAGFFAANAFVAAVLALLLAVGAVVAIGFGKLSPWARAGKPAISRPRTEPTIRMLIDRTSHEKSR
jgi:hypothetical protein